MAKGQSKHAPARRTHHAAQEPATETASANDAPAGGNGQAESVAYRPTPPGGRKKVAPENETAKDRAKRLGGPRMLKLFKAFKGVRALTTRGYELSEAARRQMADDIERESKETLRMLRETAKAPGEAASVGYTIPD
jgi:hypothetical protein